MPGKWHSYLSYMTHLVTGGSGFLGNLIARRLHSRGQRVKVLDIWEDPTRPKEIEFIQIITITDNKFIIQNRNKITI